jgi:N-methylhydantoinase B
VRDVATRTLSAEAAEKIYGVVIRDGSADEEATRALRQSMRQSRIEQGVHA